MSLPGPYEILEIKPGDSITITPLRYQLGKVVIRPTWAGAPREKEVDAIRVWVPETEKNYYPPYWDITPGHLVAALRELLPMAMRTHQKLKITAVLTRPGDPASKRFRISILPID